jgi:hypothetical protein
MHPGAAIAPTHSGALAAAESNSGSQVPGAFGDDSQAPVAQAAPEGSLEEEEAEMGWWQQLGQEGWSLALYLKDILCEDESFR